MNFRPIEGRYEWMSLDERAAVASWYPRCSPKEGRTLFSPPSTRQVQKEFRWDMCPQRGRDLVVSMVTAEGGRQQGRRDPPPEHHAGTELAFCVSHPAAEGVTRLAGGNEGDSQQPRGQMTQVQAEESSQHTPCSRGDEQAGCALTPHGPTRSEIEPRGNGRRRNS